MSAAGKTGKAVSGKKAPLHSRRKVPVTGAKPIVKQVARPMKKIMEKPMADRKLPGTPHKIPVRKESAPKALKSSKKIIKNLPKKRSTSASRHPARAAAPPKPPFTPPQNPPQPSPSPGIPSPQPPAHFPEPGSLSLERLEETFKPLFDLIEYEKKILKAYELCLNPPNVTVGSTPAEVVWEEDGIKLLHYKPFVDDPDIKPVPLLFVYALINKPYILDLQPDRSVVRQFLRGGIDCYLIDWGSPTEADRYRDTNDYINHFIDSIVDFINGKHGLDKISILGYCMGGTYSALYSALYPKKVKNLIIMAAGIDWESQDGMLRLWSDREHFHVDKIVDTYGNVSGEFLNSAFGLLNPIVNSYSKYLDMIAKVDDEMFIANFLRMEKWIRDGIPLAGEAYREFIKNTYQENKLVKGEWVVGDRAVNLRDITMPVLTLIGEKDTLIHPNETRPLLDHVSSTDKTCITFPTGHIGISVGSKLHREVWPKVVQWLHSRSDTASDHMYIEKEISPETRGYVMEDGKKPEIVGKEAGSGKTVGQKKPARPRRITRK